MLMDVLIDCFIHVCIPPLFAPIYLIEPTARLWSIVKARNEAPSKLLP